MTPLTLEPQDTLPWRVFLQACKETGFPPVRHTESGGWRRQMYDAGSELLPVGVLAVLDGVNAECLGMLLSEADTVIADAEAPLAGLALELLHVARAVLGQTLDRQEDVLAMCCGMAGMSALASSEKMIRFKRPGPCGRWRGSGPW